MQYANVQLNKRIVMAAVLGVVAIMLSLWITASPSDGKDAASLRQAQAKQQERERQIAIAKDSDSDGLKDWEELLAGTDPKNADTDGDGISDFDSVKTARENKSLNTASLNDGSAKSEFEASEDTSLTEEMVQKIFGAYVRAKLTDTYDTNSFAQVVGTVTQDAFNSTLSEEKYSAEDIKVVVDANKANVVNYRDASDKAMNPVIQIEEYELSTYARAIENEDEAETEFAKLRSAANAYRTSAANLLVVPTPKDIVGTHLELANAFYAFGDTLEDMGTVTDDPMLSYVHMRDFLEKEKKINDVFDSLKIYFSLKHGLSLE